MCTFLGSVSIEAHTPGRLPAFREGLGVQGRPIPFCLLSQTKANEVVFVGSHNAPKPPLSWGPGHLAQYIRNEEIKTLSQTDLCSNLSSATY